MRWQALLLIVLVLISFTVVKLITGSEPDANTSEASTTNQPADTPNLLAFQQAALHDTQVQKAPTRKWNVLDPEVSAKAVLVHSLDDTVPLFYFNTHEPWPMASLTKLLTALVVFEDIGLNKKIAITSTAVETEGLAGDLRSGEVYTARDLVKIMLLTSSNDAAAAFEEYLGGQNAFADAVTEKAHKIGMDETVLFDGSGLTDTNTSTATDLLKLTKYILAHHPDIFHWTRSSELLVQPINDVRTNTVYNINNLVYRDDFLGGKTGTSPIARENLITILSFKDRRIAVILLGSLDREREAGELLEWVNEAYTF